MFQVDNVNVKFYFDLVPSDMKWIAFFAGELNNAARYFSTFANVSVDDMTQVNGTLGEDDDCTWRPWKYEKEWRMSKKLKISRKQSPILQSQHKGLKFLIT